MNRFTKEDMKTLSQWEKNMRTAILSRYLRNVGKSAVQTIAEIWARKLGVAKVAVNDSCPACVLDLLQRVGRAYFEQQEVENKKTKKSKTKTE
jgi:hypothetical protein